MRGSPHSAKKNHENRVEKTRRSRAPGAHGRSQGCWGGGRAGGGDEKGHGPCRGGSKSPDQTNGPSFVLFVHRCACWLRPGRRQSEKILSRKRKQQYHPCVRGPSLNPLAFCGQQNPLISSTTDLAVTTSTRTSFTSTRTSFPLGLLPCLLADNKVCSLFFLSLFPLPYSSQPRSSLFCMLVVSLPQALAETTHMGVLSNACDMS